MGVRTARVSGLLGLLSSVCLSVPPSLLNLGSGFLCCCVRAGRGDGNSQPLPTGSCLAPGNREVGSGSGVRPPGPLPGRPLWPHLLPIRSPAVGMRGFGEESRCPGAALGAGEGALAGWGRGSHLPGTLPPEPHCVRGPCEALVPELPSQDLGPESLRGKKLIQPRVRATRVPITSWAPHLYFDPLPTPRSLPVSHWCPCL